MESIAGKVRRILKEELRLEDNQIKDNSKIIEDLGADSLDQVEIVMALEEEFKMDIPDEVAETLTTVKEVIDHMKEI